MADAVLAIEIGGTKLQLAAGTGDGRVAERQRHAVDASRGASGIRERIAAALPALCQRHRPRAVGIGFGGPVDWRTGRVWGSYQVDGWGGFELAGWVGDLAGCPAFVENDANTAALGEAVASAGAGTGANPVCYITLGSGVGAGLVVDGAIFHAAPPGELELGHVRLDRSGVAVQDRCAGWALDARVRTAAAEAPQARLAALLRQQSGGPPAAALGAALAEHDAAAQRLLDDYAAELAFGLSHVVHLVHPQVIVIGGGVALLGEPLRAAIAAHLPRFVMDSFRPGLKVALSALREDAVPVGALLLAARRL